jgi:DNA-dependent metalloprotease WSS1
MSRRSSSKSAKTYNSMETKIVALKKQPNSDHAHKLLEKLLAHTRRICTERNWRVVELHEFYPSNPNLLGINVNRKFIKVRLRSPTDNTKFLEFHDLIGTMLHELVHMKFGPHDAKFYKLLDEIYTEYENSLDNGFKPDGDRLGGREKTAEERLREIERRNALSKIMHIGGKRLGGQRSQKSMRELLADAAERRLRDSKWCSTDEHESEDLVGAAPEEIKGEPSKAGSSRSVPISNREPTNRLPMKINKRPRDGNHEPVFVDLGEVDHPTIINTQWSCKMCTFVNEKKKFKCEMCDTEKKAGSIEVVCID